MLFHRVPEPKTTKNRVHLDVRGTGAVDDEVERLIGLGARRLRATSDDAGYFVVMEDPEGNAFCVD